MEPMVVIGTRSEGLAVYGFNQIDVDGSGYALIEVTGTGMTATSRVYMWPTPRAFVDFLASLEDDWKGWQGERDWHGLEGELSISARHTGSHVIFTIKMQRDNDWSVELAIPVGAGSELTEIVAAAERALIPSAL